MPLAAPGRGDALGIPRGLSRLRCDIISTAPRFIRADLAGFDAVGAPARERLILCMMMRLGQRVRGAAAMNGISARSSKASMSIFQVSARATPAATPCVSSLLRYYCHRGGDTIGCR
jgi:hypothetical protein